MGGATLTRMSHTIVWRPGASLSVRPTTAQRGRVIPGQPVAGQELQSIPHTLIVSELSDVYAQVLEYGGDVTVICDSSLTLGGYVEIPAGVVLPGFGVDPTTGVPLESGPPMLRFKGGTANAGTQTTIVVRDTARVLGPASLEDIVLSCEARTVVPIVIGATLDLKRSTIENRAAAVVACINTPNGFHGVCRADNRSSINPVAAIGPGVIRLGTTGGGAACTWGICATMGFTSLGADA